MLVRILVVVAGIVVLALAGVFAAGRGVLGRHEDPGQVTTRERDAALDAARAAGQAKAASAIGVAEPKQILFGDLHVHTTFSFDAFLTSLPVTQGEGAHPPADACDFARYCSALDFWSINDHAEAISPTHWRETVESIRQCNAVAGDPRSPDTVAFLGWEWTQVGATPDEHWGHKNVVLAHTDEGRIPPRPIAATSTYERIRRGTSFPTLGIGAVALLSGEPRMHDFARFLAERRGLEPCDPDVDTRELPPDCIETAAEPRDLFRKLDAWGHDSIVIPHGTTWGFYTPPGSTWRHQLTPEQHDPDRQTLFEIYSGHGNSDEYRSWRAVELEGEGVPGCPEPRAGYLPTCWRAGEIIRERCLADGETDATCEERARDARRNAVAAGSQAHLTVPGARAADWLDAGQCRDCAQPAFNYRPGGSAQYVMALRSFENDGAPMRFRFGFMSSSDNHFARPGTGFKEVHRYGFTESRNRSANGGGSGAAGAALAPPSGQPAPESRPFDAEASGLTGFQLFELERQSNFFMTGGLIAAHATGRDRASIWEAMTRREVYGTSGPRILLWFDLLNPPGTRGDRLPMGSETAMQTSPIFQVRAVGSFEQRPGCPDDSVSALGPDEIERICKGECYHPSNQRRVLTRIEVIRIRPQREPGETLASLIEDPWRSFPCEPDRGGCSVTFDDPDFAAAGRDTVYYVRALEEPAPAINAAGISCRRDAGGRCLEATFCASGSAEDDCLSEHEPRAWSSPIFVDFAGG
ncbi:MAG: DUF3604 domain-containing protein [Myxococcota bacterium]|nr:DUF3604 domain-containing protein [Myxococcota bacterium]